VGAMRGGLSIAIVCAACAIACGGGEAQIAEKNRVFYAFDSTSPELAAQFETPYPPLDLKGTDRMPEYRGVAVLDGKVRISRPTDWLLRSATNEPSKRFVSYVSPHEYLFAIYEWPDRPDAPWREVMTRFEESAKASHAEIIEKPVPVATWNAQGRAYVVRRKVPASKTPYVNTSYEILARGENRIVLVQVVHQGESIEPESPELLRVIETLELL
jgi:hypothetical protein